MVFKRNMEILIIENLSLSLNGRDILKNLSLAIEDGIINSILGSNAAGKSTLANVIMGLGGFRPQKGRIIFMGEDITDYSVHKRAKMGLTLAWQEPARFEGITVRDYIAVGMKEKDENLIKEVLELVMLDPKEYMNRYVDKTLSGGERKRIELASVFAMKPKLAILDEPDSGIDILALENIIELIKELKRRGSTVLLITHREDVAIIADKASLMCSGFIIKEGRTEEVCDYFRKKCIPCPTHIYPEESDKNSRK